MAKSSAESLAFDKFVGQITREGEQPDMIRLIAYAFYKEEKVAYVKSETPTTNQIRHFIKTHTTDIAIDNYCQRAQTLLAGYGSVLLSAKIETIISSIQSENTRVIENAEGHLKLAIKNEFESIKEDITDPKVWTWKNFWFELNANFWSAIAVPVVLLLLIYFAGLAFKFDITVLIRELISAGDSSKS
jgi:hypothetical protein